MLGIVAISDSGAEISDFSTGISDFGAESQMVHAEAHIFSPVWFGLARVNFFRFAKTIDFAVATAVTTAVAMVQNDHGVP